MTVAVSTWATSVLAADPSPPDAARIKILYDAFGRHSSLRKDWGFAALIEINGKRILFDTGNNAEIFADNARAMSVDLTDLDFVVMSHRHGDHIGGLNHVLAVNGNVPIYAPKENFGVFGASFPGTFYRGNDRLEADERYFDGEPPAELRFGTPWPGANFSWIAETSEILPGFHIIALRGLWGVDLEVVELSLAVETDDGVVLVIGCGHPMVEKIVEQAKLQTGKDIHFVIGGLHLLPADEAETRAISINLRVKWQVGWIAPAHCTGELAFELLKQIFDERYLYAGLGTTIELGKQPRSLTLTPAQSRDALYSDYRQLAKYHARSSERRHPTARRHLHR